MASKYDHNTSYFLQAYPPEKSIFNQGFCKSTEDYIRTIIVTFRIKPSSKIVIICDVTSQSIIIIVVNFNRCRRFGMGLEMADCVQFTNGIYSHKQQIAVRNTFDYIIPKIKTKSNNEIQIK